MSSLWNKMVMCVESASVVMVMLPARRRNANRLQDACSTRRVRHSAVLHAKTQEQVCLIFTRHTGANRNFYIIMSYMWLLQKKSVFCHQFERNVNPFSSLAATVQAPAVQAPAVQAPWSQSRRIQITDDDIVCWMLAQCWGGPMYIVILVAKQWQQRDHGKRLSKVCQYCAQACC